MSFLKSSLLVSGGTLSSRILGFLRDLLIAKFLGAGISSDIFFIGLRIPNTVRQIFGEGAFNLVFVPMLKNRCDGNKINAKALNFIEKSFSLFIFSILIILIVSEIFMPEIVNFLVPALKEKGADIFELAVNVSRLVMPYILFVSYMTFTGAMLNSLGKFAAMAFAPALVNLGYILAFSYVWLFKVEVQEMAYVPSAGFLFGGFLQFALMYLTVRKLPFKIKIKKPVVDEEMKELFYKFVPTMLSSGIVILNSLVSVFLASSLETGAVSYLFYSDRLIQLPTAIFGTAVATVLLPNLTQKLKNNSNISTHVSKVLTVNLVMAALCASYLFIFSELIVNTLFQRGSFDINATYKTSLALAVGSLALPAIMGIKAVSMVFYAKGKTKTPTIISGFAFIINLILCLILMRYFSYVGLVMAGVVSVYFNLITQILILIFNRSIKYLDIVRPFSIFVVFQSVTFGTFLLLKKEWNISFEDAIITKIIYLGITGILGFIVMLFVGYLFGLHRVLKIRW